MYTRFAPDTKDTRRPAPKGSWASLERAPQPETPRGALLGSGVHTTSHQEGAVGVQFCTQGPWVPEAGEGQASFPIPEALCRPGSGGGGTALSRLLMGRESHSPAQTRPFQPDLHNRGPDHADISGQSVGAFCEQGRGQWGWMRPHVGATESPGPVHRLRVSGCRGHWKARASRVGCQCIGTGGRRGRQAGLASGRLGLWGCVGLEPACMQLARPARPQLNWLLGVEVASLQPPGP